MKLLTEVIDYDELTRIRILFGAKGVPIFIGNEDSARNFGLIYPARKYAIFVIYENQYHDALKLLDDENHSAIAFNKLFKVIMSIGASIAVLITAIVVIVIYS